MSDNNLHTVNLEARRRWDHLGAWWASAMGKGDTFHREMIFPALMELLPPHTEHLLDLACGTGQTTRFLCNHVKRLTAVDYSEAMLSEAKKHSAEHANIEYGQMDLLNPAEWEKRASETPDAATLSMALHDIASIEPIAAGLRAIASIRHIVIVTPHPAFNNPTVVDFSEQHYGETWKTVQGVKVTNYLHEFTADSRAKESQPVAQLVFHRPLSALLGPFLKHGFVVDKLIEPVYIGQRVAGIPLILGLRLLRV